MAASPFLVCAGALLVLGLAHAASDDVAADAKAKFEGFEHLTVCRKGGERAQNQVLGGGGLQAHFGAPAAPARAWPGGLRFHQAGRSITVTVHSVSVERSFFYDDMGLGDYVQLRVYADGLPIAAQPAQVTVHEGSTHNFAGGGLVVNADFEVRINVFEMDSGASLIGVAVFQAPKAGPTNVTVVNPEGNAIYRLGVTVAENAVDSTGLVTVDSANAGNSIIRHFTLCAMSGDYFNGKHNFGANPGQNRFVPDIISFDITDNALGGPGVVQPARKGAAARTTAFNNVFNDWWDALAGGGAGGYNGAPYSNGGQDYYNEFRRMTTMLISFITMERGAKSRHAAYPADMYAETVPWGMPEIERYDLHTNSATENSARISIKLLPDITHYNSEATMALGLLKPWIDSSPVMQGLYVNFDHFGDAHAQWSYDTGHEQAIDDAIAAAAVGGGGAAVLAALKKAVAKDGQACHYATDQFAAGHVRSPRADMYKWRFSWWCGGGCGWHKVLPRAVAGQTEERALTSVGLIANTVHDEENEWGLYLESGNAIWKARGDKHYFLRPMNAENANQGAEFVKHSLRDLIFAFTYGVKPMTKTEYDAGGVPARLATYTHMTRDHSPFHFLPTAMPDMPHGPNFPPVFKRFWDGANNRWVWKYRTTMPNADRSYLAGGAGLLEAREYTDNWSCTALATYPGGPHSIKSIRGNLGTVVKRTRAHIDAINSLAGFDTDGDGVIGNNDWVLKCTALLAPPFWCYAAWMCPDNVYDVNTRYWRPAMLAVKQILQIQRYNNPNQDLLVNDLDFVATYNNQGFVTIEEFIKRFVVQARRTLDPAGFLEESSTVDTLATLHAEVSKLQRSQTMPTTTSEVEALMDKDREKKKIAKDIGFVPGKPVYKIPGETSHEIAMTAEERDKAWVKQKKWIQNKFKAHFDGVAEELTKEEQAKLKKFIKEKVETVKLLNTQDLTEKHINERFAADKKLAVELKKIVTSKVDSKEKYEKAIMMEDFQIKALLKIEKPDKEYADLWQRVQHERSVVNVYQSTLYTPEMTGDKKGKPNALVAMLHNKAWAKLDTFSQIASGISAGKDICCCAPGAPKRKKQHALTAAMKNSCVSTRASSCGDDPYAKGNGFTKDMSSTYKGTCMDLYEKASELETKLRERLVKKKLVRPKIEVAVKSRVPLIKEEVSMFHSLRQMFTSLWTTLVSSRAEDDPLAKEYVSHEKVQETELAKQLKEAAKALAKKGKSKSKTSLASGKGKKMDASKIKKRGKA